MSDLSVNIFISQCTYFATHTEYNYNDSFDVPCGRYTCIDVNISPDWNFISVWHENKKTHEKRHKREEEAFNNTN